MSSTEQHPPEIEQPGALPREQPAQQADPQERSGDRPGAEQDTYGEPGEQAPTTGDGEAVNDEDLPLPNRPANERLASDDLDGEVPD
ncbi:hypothetical protein QDR37_11450 [Amnibacterium sp. CER49]|uniref:hypothetical protein n=1 Tax=Amnibacterium sp. CER49 TaxID=3039161 RepID=UPI00244847AB|nr:hypothetical protein [Amnibacterium sp. CER49]MDH2444561.1 hypothetical protein [Amnibacterium sp. CER49]